ncbi:MAG: SH3 domain-containing protein, partial [Aridibacter sp.]
MKYVRNGFVLLIIFSLPLFVYAVQTKNLTSNPNQKPVETSEIVVSVMGGRIRSEPNLQGKILKESTIGAKFTVLEEKNGWSKIELKKAVENEEAETGWIANSITAKFDSAKPGVLYQQITDKYFKKESMDFRTAKELVEFLPRAADEAKTFEVGGDLRLKKLTALSNALKAIPIDKKDNSPYKEFLEKYKSEIVYSEPSAQWYVRSDNSWQLHQRYKDYKIGEEMAWQAAGNPIPGECEGYINCYLYALRVTNGEYLNFYPNGKYSR